MAYVEVNVTKVREAGEDIITLSNDFNNIIKNLSSLFDDLKTDEVWVGPDADAYIQKSKLELEDYYNLGNAIKEIGNIYLYSATAIDTFIKGNNINE